VALKNYASAYIERSDILRGVVFVLVMPEDIVPGVKRLLIRARGGGK
jgi:hypothetical protein